MMRAAGAGLARRDGQPPASKRPEPDFLEKNSRKSGAAYAICEFQTRPDDGRPHQGAVVCGGNERKRAGEGVVGKDLMLQRACLADLAVLLIRSLPAPFSGIFLQKFSAGEIRLSFTLTSDAGKKGKAGPAKGKRSIWQQPVPMWGKADDLRLTVVMGLRKGLKLVRGMRRSLSDDDQHKPASAIVEHLE
jgi:hypothetical protein